MRIACLYLPSFPLQAYLRRAPHLAGAAFAVAEGASVVAVSHAAWALGVRPGAIVARARAMVAELVVLPRDRAAERQAIDAIVDCLMGCTDAIDASAGGARDVGDTDPWTRRSDTAIYMRVPARVRAARFAHGVLGQLMRQGLRGRIGVADDRFTAYAAAVTRPGPDGAQHVADAGRLPQVFDQAVTEVPRGESAAFLAPLPLDMLPIELDVQTVLRTLRVTTVGDFAQLPPPSAARTDPGADDDVRALARGHGPAALRGAKVSAIVTESIDLPAPADRDGSVFALRTLCDRACLRLSGRGGAALRLELLLTADDGRATAVRVALPAPTTSARTLLDALRAELAQVGLAHPVSGVRLEVTEEVEPMAATLDLFGTRTAVGGGHIEAARVDRKAGHDTGHIGDDAGAAREVFALTAPNAPGTGHRRTRKKAATGRRAGKRPRTISLFD